MSRADESEFCLGWEAFVAAHERGITTRGAQSDWFWRGYGAADGRWNTEAFRARAGEGAVAYAGLVATWDGDPSRVPPVRASRGTLLAQAMDQAVRRG